MSREVSSSITIQPSASRTANPPTATYNVTAAGIVVVIDVTANAGGLGSITVTISGVDPASGKTWAILASAALTGVATTTLKVGRNLTAAANSVANDQVPGQVQVSVNHNNANPITYSVGLNTCAV